MRKSTLRERLLSKAVVNFETDCWEWTGTRTCLGYGQIRVHGILQSAHRVAYEMIQTPIPPGLVIDHLCRNRSCVNPAHMEPVTAAENTRRALLTSAVADHTRDRCSHGHELTPANTYALRGKPSCRTCNREAAKRYKDAHPGRVRAKNAEYRQRVKASDAFAKGGAK